MYVKVKCIPIAGDLLMGMLEDIFEVVRYHTIIFALYSHPSYTALSLYYIRVANFVSSELRKNTIKEEDKTLDCGSQ